MNCPTKSIHPSLGSQSPSWTLAAVSSTKSGRRQCKVGVPSKSVTHRLFSCGWPTEEARLFLFSASAPSASGKSLDGSKGRLRAGACPALCQYWWRFLFWVRRSLSDSMVVQVWSWFKRCVKSRENWSRRERKAAWVFSRRPPCLCFRNVLHSISRRQPQ